MIPDSLKPDVPWWEACDVCRTPWQGAGSSIVCNCGGKTLSDFVRRAKREVLLGLANRIADQIEYYSQWTSNPTCAQCNAPITETGWPCEHGSTRIS